MPAGSTFLARLVVVAVVGVIGALSPAPAVAQSRPKVGIALGGGSAKGIAHIGVLRWLEEHHVPIDVVAGTSMGGLVGGAYATGMTPDELGALIATTNWDAMFGASNFDFMNVRRKADARDYPSHLEYGLKKGLMAPPSLNSGQQVDFMLARIAAPYYGIATFDALPTPFRCVAVDLKTAKFIVLDRGSLATAMRATMSLPLVFPPVAVDNYLLVDGGALNNVPADVVRDMGAARVIAVNVGNLTDDQPIMPSMLGLLSSTVDAMMRANTLRTLASADVVINVPLTDFGSLDWRRHLDLVRAGYDAAEAMKSHLLPLAVDDATWQQWSAARQKARRTSLPPPSFVRVEGASAVDEARIRYVLEQRIGKPFDVDGVQADITRLGGLERYETMTWRMVSEPSGDGLLVTARPKTYGPPFLLLAVSLENTTSNTFRFSLSSRYLSFDNVGSGSELRIDGTVGSDPSAGVSLYKPIGKSSFFVEAGAGVASKTLNVIEDELVVATYGRTDLIANLEGGVNIDRIDDVRGGMTFGYLDAASRVGDPGLPELNGNSLALHVRWRHDGQDNATLPTRGRRSVAVLRHYFQAPRPPEGTETTRQTEGVTQFEIQGLQVVSRGGGSQHRFFASGGLGTSFNGQPLPTEQFALGGPLRLSAFGVDELRGDHFGVVSAGYLYQVARLPDLFGGPVMVGGWIDTGSAFDHWKDANVAADASAAIITDTIIGPVFAGASVGLNGTRSRFYIGIGRILR